MPRLPGAFLLCLALVFARDLDAADRVVVWVRADDADFERDLNLNAARGLRLAAISDGLPCTVAALQAPERETPAVSYRVVREGELAAALPGCRRRSSRRAIARA